MSTGDTPGAITAAEQAVAIHNAAAHWNRALLENAARPSGALVYDGGDAATLTPDQFERLKAELASAFSGQANASNSLIKSALPEADRPNTPTSAAIPIVIPSADSADRSFRVLRPELPTRRVSSNPKWLIGFCNCSLRLSVN